MDKAIIVRCRLKISGSLNLREISPVGIKTADSLVPAAPFSAQIHHDADKLHWTKKVQCEASKGFHALEVVWIKISYSHGLVVIYKFSRSMSVEHDPPSLSFPLPLLPSLSFPPNSQLYANIAWNLSSNSSFNFDNAL